MLNLEAMSDLSDQIADIQSTRDDRNLKIEKVGVRGIRHPIVVFDESVGEQHTIAEFDMYVELPGEQKGTHMSRFVQILNDQSAPLSTESFCSLLEDTAKMLGAERSEIRATFPFFVEKRAPVSGCRSLMDYVVSFDGQTNPETTVSELEVVVPVTSLCPCSKEISDYGAHNQRSHVALKVKSNAPIGITMLIQLVESEASCELFGTLKRADEKYVTEYAYDNPKFVEDLVRDIAQKVNRHHHICEYSVTAENFESIHNHSAYASITGRPGNS